MRRTAANPSPRPPRAAPAAAAKRTPAAPAPHRYGSHLSIAGGVCNAIDAARRLGFDAVQIFVKNQRQWAAPPLSAEAIAAWHERMQAGFAGPAVAHASYLINLGSADGALWARSRDALADELVRCDALGIGGLVFHPGAAGEAPLSEALRRVARALDEIFDRRPALRCMPLLETTAGQGTTLGRTFEELGEIVAALREPQRVGVCIDTCHVFAAGYDIRDPAAYTAMIDAAERCVGLHRVRCWHLNDSRGACGSRLDRHEHVGRGQIGAAGFRHVLRDARFFGLPMILETPKELDERGREWDRVNLRKLKRIASSE